MNKGLLFAVALSLCFLNQLRPMCNNDELTKEQIDELEKNNKKINELDEELDELKGDDEELDEPKADIDDSKNIGKLVKNFLLFYSEMEIAFKKTCTLLQKNTIENENIRFGEILERYNFIVKLLNEWKEMVKKNKDILNGTPSLEEKDIFEKMITCAKDMIEKMGSIIAEIEGRVLA